MIPSQTNDKSGRECSDQSMVALKCNVQNARYVSAIFDIEEA